MEKETDKEMYGGLTKVHSSVDNCRELSDIFINRMNKALIQCYPNLEFVFLNNFSLCNGLCSDNEWVTMSVFTAEGHDWIFRFDCSRGLVVGMTFFDSFVYLVAKINQVISKYMRKVL